jgi:tetratricopeptide (TPR) repeat protein
LVKCLSLVLSLAIVVPDAADRPRIERLQHWLAAVERHEPGTADDPAVEVGSWSRTELQTLGVDLASLAQLMRSPNTNVFFLGSNDRRPRRPILYTRTELERLRGLARAAARHDDENFVMKRGALLHADIAMLVPGKSEPLDNRPPSGSQRFMMLSTDGRQLSVEHTAVHWELARTLLDNVMPDPSRDAMVRLWYRATAAYLESRVQLDLVPLFDRARQLFPDDADLLFYGGCLHETFAAPRIQVAVQTAVLPPGMWPDVVSEHAELRQAETFFKRALDIEPGMAEARIRLGRVLALQGRHADAARELRRALEATSDSLLLYYAELFLGGEEEALDHRDAARASYEHAAALYPRAQSPHLALSQLARRFGDRAGALRAIQQVLRPPADESDRDDPWWTYHTAQGRNADDLLAALRKPFLSRSDHSRDDR